MTYPKFKYHPSKPDFLCPSEAFFLTLEDHDEYEDIPFTGDRKVTKKSRLCVECISKKIIINELESKIEELEINNSELQSSSTDLELEVERLRIALKMAQNADIKVESRNIGKPGRPKKR